MLRVLPRALRLPCSWRFSGARDCASHATTRTPEIQVQALTGPNQGADLKEREQMSDVEVGTFVQRLRGLMSEIGGTQRLPRCLGVALAKELIFTGRRLNGAQARELGLVNHAVAQNEEGNAAYHRALALAQEILPQAPIAVRLGKVAIDRGMEVDIASGMAIEQMCYAQNIPTQDRLEGMAAFREKRAPKFVGK